MQEQVVSIWAGTNGYLDALPIEDVLRFERELIDWFNTRHSDVMNEIRDHGTIADADAFAAAVQAFADQFSSSAASDGDEPEAEAQPAAQAALVDSDVTLPEEDITRDED